jgi:hypothetical protein
MRTAVLVLVALVVAAGPATAEVKVGDVLAAQSRGGTVLREAPAGLAKVVATVPFGTRVLVQEVLGYHARVSTQDGTTGWVRSADLVAPTALTGAGARAASGTAAFTAAEVSAAGRQFDQKTERTYREMASDMTPHYATVDALETSSPPDVELDAFVREGVLGRCGNQPVQSLAPLPPSRPLLPWRGEAVSTEAPRTATGFVARMKESFSPEQEYWLGRSVVAAAVAEHGLDPDAGRQAAVRRIGGALVRLSNRIGGTYGGWHFAVLDSPVANGLSGPGGFVLVTRGALERARDEDEVAGVLAHEIAHVSMKHGEQVIRRSREFQESLKKLEGLAATEPPGGECVVFCGEVARVLGETAKGLVTELSTEGYGKDFEFKADWEGSLLLCEAGYRVGSISRYLETLPDRADTDWTTHPSSADRIAALAPIVRRHAGIGSEGYAARCRRFDALMGRGARPPLE